MKHKITRSNSLLALLLTVCSIGAKAQSYNAINFDGVNDYISLPSSNTLPLGNSDYTIEAWIKTNGMGAYGIIGWGPYWSNNQVNAFRLSSNGIDNYWWANDINIATTNIVSTWHHVAVTFNGTERILYVDGSSIGSDFPGTVHAVPYSTNATIGQTYPGEYFNGAMDELRVWNRALCPAELLNNMNGELPNPTTQVGLVAYYKMDQGTASGTNTSVTTLIDASGNGNNATLNNFALSGSTSNWVSGATAITGNVTQYAAALPSSLTESVTKTIGASATPFSGCGMINSITPTGTTTAVAGTIVSKVTKDASTNTYFGRAYVQRHYDIEPTTNPNTSTANITLYFTQADFTAYNTDKGAAPSLPTSSSDLANAANLRIMQFHGVPTGGHAPANYPTTWTGSGPAAVILTPSSVTWNSTYSRWEVTVGITGFSGFFATTSPSPLPVGLTSFSAALNNDKEVLLNWAVAMPKDGNGYIIERSTDAEHFTSIGSVEATTASNYTFHDLYPPAGKSYYRLRILDIDGSETFSHTETVFSAVRTYLSVYPMPAKDYLVVETNDAGMKAGTLTDLQGRQVMQINIGERNKTDISSLPAGLYLLKARGQTFKVVKE